MCYFAIDSSEPAKLQSAKEVLLLFQNPHDAEFLAFVLSEEGVSALHSYRLKQEPCPIRSTSVYSAL